MGEEDRLLTLDEVATRLAVSKATVVRRIKDKSLRAFNVGTEKNATYRIREADLSDFLRMRLSDPTGTTEQGGVTPGHVAEDS